MPEEGIGDTDSPTDEDAEASGSEEPSGPQHEVGNKEEWEEEEEDQYQEEPLPDEPVSDIDALISSLSRSEDRQESEASAAEPETGQETESPESEEEAVGESFSEFLRKGAGLPQFQVPSEMESPVEVPEPQAEEDDSDFSRLFDVDQTPDEVSVDADTEHPAPSEEAADRELSPLSSISAESGDTLSIREHLWPVADSKDEEDGEDMMPPLSISSRRKGSPLVPVVIGIILLLALAGGGFYLFMGNGPDVADLVPESVRNAVGLEAKSACPVEIRSLEGVFLSNKDAGEIFVMRGDAFNVSMKPLTTIQVKGKIFGPKGEVLAERTVFCGNVLSGQQLAFQPYSSMEKVMNRQFGETLANLDVQPGKGISFMIVFKAVPKGASEYAVEVVSPVGPVAP
jgi:hypothetical protein